MDNFNNTQMSEKQRHRKPSNDVIDDVFIERFIKKHPQYKGKVTRRSLQHIIKTFHNLIIQETITNRNGVELLNTMGLIILYACEYNKLPTRNIDFQHFLKTGEKKRFSNLHTDNKLLKIKYTNDHLSHTIAHRSIWKFQPCRIFARAASADFKQNYQRYPIAESFYIGKQFRNAKRKERIKNLKQVIPEGYDEFKI
jgi:hypothetical protein